MRCSVISLAIALCLASPALAHEGEDHAAAPGTESAAGALSGPIEVSEVAQRNLGLAVAEAELRSVETTLRVIGEIQADPARSGTVSSRIAGRVTAVFAQEGERVEKGQGLVEVESLQLGDPPPRARYASPVSGLVTDRHVVVGDDVEPNRHLLEVADLREVLAVGRAFEGQIGDVSVGQKVRVRVPSYPSEIFEGAVERLGGKLDANSRSLAVYIRVANPDERLRPHMRATLSLVTGGAELALAIPKSAALGEAGNLYAFVQNEDRPERFERRPLVLGVSNDQYVEVIEGLFPGERVVTEGNYSLQYLTPIPDEADDGAEVAATADGEVQARPETTWTAPLGWAAGLLAALAAALVLYRLLRGRPHAAREAR
jgi:multidrug efflux pump subunit AcrA (membrane-fusion protein)